MSLKEWELEADEFLAERTVPILQQTAQKLSGAVHMVEMATERRRKFVFHFAGSHGWPPHNLQAVQEGPFSKSAKELLQTEGLLQPRGGAAIACTVLPVRDYLVEKIFRSLQLIVPTWLTVAQNRDGCRT